MNAVKDLLKSGKTVVGTAGSVFEDNMSMLGDSGFDFILFDTQHSAVEVKQYNRAVKALSGTKAAPIVRVSANRADLICFALDIGARGIIVPMVNTRKRQKQWSGPVNILRLETEATQVFVVNGEKQVIIEVI